MIDQLDTSAWQRVERCLVIGEATTAVLPPPPPAGWLTVVVSPPVTVDAVVAAVVHEIGAVAAPDGRVLPQAGDATAAGPQDEMFPRAGDAPAARLEAVLLLGADDGTADRLAAAVRLPVVAPAGPVLATPGGTLFAPGGPAIASGGTLSAPGGPVVGTGGTSSAAGSGWWRHTPDGRRVAEGSRWPAPHWQSLVPDGTAWPGGTRPVPAGWLLSPAPAPGVEPAGPTTGTGRRGAAKGAPDPAGRTHPGAAELADAVAVDPDRPRLLTAPGVTATELAAALRALPPAVRRSAEVVPLAPGQGAGRATASAAARLLGEPLHLVNGVPLHAPSGGVAVHALDAALRPVWTEPARLLRFGAGGQEEVVASSPPQSSLRPIGPATYAMDLGWHVRLSGGGLHAEPAPAPAAPSDPARGHPEPAEERPEPAEAHAGPAPAAPDGPYRVVVGTPGAPIDDLVWPALSALFTALLTDVPAPVELVVAGDATAWGLAAARELADRHRGEPVGSSPAGTATSPTPADGADAVVPAAISGAGSGVTAGISGADSSGPAETGADAGATVTGGPDVDAPVAGGATAGTPAGVGGAGPDGLGARRSGAGVGAGRPFLRAEWLLPPPTGAAVPAAGRVRADRRRLLLAAAAVVVLLLVGVVVAAWPSGQRGTGGDAADGQRWTEPALAPGAGSTVAGAGSSPSRARASASATPSAGRASGSPSPSATGTPAGAAATAGNATPPPANLGAGGDLAAGRATAESGHTDVYAASRITDGDASTYWESRNNAFPQWVQVDLGGAAPLGRAVLRLPPSLLWGPRTQRIEVQASTDGSRFTTLVAPATYGFDLASGQRVTISLPGTPWRYVRLVFTANSVQPAGQLSALELYQA